MIHLETHSWLQHVVAPMMKLTGISLTRGYQMCVDYAACGYVVKLRKCQIDAMLRMFRYCFTNGG